MTKPTEFDPEELPWLDAHTAGIDAYVGALDTDEDKDELRYRLLNWTHFGYATIPGAIEHSLVDAMLADVDEALSRHTEFHTTVGLPGHTYEKLKDLDPAVIDSLRANDRPVNARLMDFIHNSVAAKLISTHLEITRFLEHLSGERMVAIQSLNFFVGSQQFVHQDYAFVRTTPQSQLVASWVALEDIHPDSGPLFYVPGSHRLRKFDWEPGLVQEDGAARDEFEFTAHIDREIDKAGLPRITFCPKKGDVFIWHAALAHGGSPVRDPTRTRKSYVTHYSLAATHHSHVHSDGEAVDRVEYPGGFVLKHPLYPEEEDVLRNADRLTPRTQ